jgi:hypothetical protein
LKVAGIATHLHFRWRKDDGSFGSELLEVGLGFVHFILALYQLALESHWVALENLELRLLDDFCELFFVAATTAAALWAAVKALGEALTVKF